MYTTVAKNVSEYRILQLDDMSALRLPLKAMMGARSMIEV